MKLIEKPLDRSEWLKARNRDADGLCQFGGSDAASLVNQSKWRTAADTFVSKCLEPVESDTTPAMHLGNIAEPMLLEEAGLRLGRDFVTPQVMYKAGRWCITMDGVDLTEKPNWGVECKVTSRHAVNEIGDLWPDVMWQVWAQQMVLECPVSVIVLDRNLNISLIDVPRNKDAEKVLKERAELIGSAVDQGVTDPSIIGASFTAEHITALVKAEPTSVELPVESLDWLALLDDSRRMVKQGEEGERRAKDAIAEMLMQHEVGTVNGQAVVTWKQQAGRASLDTKRLKADHPELWVDYEKTGSPFRTMRILTKGNN